MIIQLGQLERIYTAIRLNVASDVRSSNPISVFRINSVDREQIEFVVHHFRMRLQSYLGYSVDGPQHRQRLNETERI